MGAGAPTPGAGGKVRRLEVAGGRATFDADQRTHDRENTPVIIDGHTFLRARKDWATSRAMRSIMREQEKNVALANRLRIRVGELEVEQAEAATEADDARELELEGKIDELVAKADAATEAAEIVSYRLLALLLIPQAFGEDEEVLPGFGPVEDPEQAAPAIAFLQPALDVEDAANLANELTGSSEPDPPETPSSESGST